MISEIVKESYKYIIYNKEGKILLFTHENNEKRKDDFFLPSFKPYKESKKNYLTCEILKIINFYGSLLHKYQRKDTIFSAINNKLKSENAILYKTGYYAIYHEFTKNDYDTIFNIAIHLGFIPYMVTINEFYDLILQSGQSKMKDEDSTIHAVNTLNKKLKYEEY